jgi:hypothetical protein
MKTNIMKIGRVLLAVGICAWCADVRAQVTTNTTSVTTTDGAFTEFVPGSETVVVRTEANPAPLRYVVTKQTTVVDEGGAPIAIEKVSPGSPLSVQFTGTGDRLVASRIVVHQAPVATERHTTTTTTRALTHDEKEALEEHREDRKERRKDAIEKEKDRLDDLKDKVEDEDDDD